MMKSLYYLRLLAASCMTILLQVGCSEFISPDIGGRSLVVNSPFDSLYSNNPVTSFWWEDQSEIEQYNLRITKGTIGNVTLLLDTVMVGTTLSYSLGPNGKYNWQVRGVNEGSETLWSQGVVFVDQTNPEKATATNMHNGDTLLISNGDTIRWISTDFPLEGTFFPTTDSLLLYRRNDSTQIGGKYYYDAQEPRLLAISSSSPSPLSGAGTYWWRVLTIDLAGNRTLSDYFKFVIN